MYCKNCGAKLKDGSKFCTNCGSTNYGNISNNRVSSNDKPSVWVILACIFCPLVGLVLYFVLKDTEIKKAKCYGKSSLISFIVGIILMFCLFFFMGLLAYFAFDKFKESDFEVENGEVYDAGYFAEVIDDYVYLAKGSFLKDLYADNSVIEKCYNIDELNESSLYDGSISVSYVDGKIKVNVWLTDYIYYVDGIDYDDYIIDDIQFGDKVDKFCKTGKVDNSF